MTNTSVSKICSIEGCDRKHDSHTYCKMHAKRFKRNGHPNRVKNHYLATSATPELRFWERVAVTANPDKCWEWQAGRSKKGYGSVWVNERVISAHRAAWFYTYGTMPTLCVMHTCDNPPCVNPHHLRLGTIADNNQDKVNKGRQSCGTMSNRTKFADCDVLNIRDTYRAGGITQIELAHQYNVTSRTIWDIVNYRHWRHLP